MLKKLFYASGSILMLALAYHFGATSATAQAPGNPVVGLSMPGSGTIAVVTADGTVYGNAGSYNTPFAVVGHVFGGPTPAAQPTWGQLKTQYRR